MLKLHKKFVSFVTLLLFILVSSLSSNGYADNGANKNDKIDQEFGCIAKRLEANAQLDWSDVCYNASEEISDQFDSNAYDEYAFNESTDYYSEYMAKYDVIDEVDENQPKIETYTDYKPAEDFQITVYPDKVVANYDDDSSWEDIIAQEEQEELYYEMDDNEYLEDDGVLEEDNYIFEQDYDIEDDQSDDNIAIKSIEPVINEDDFERQVIEEDQQEQVYQTKPRSHHFSKNRYTYQSDRFDGIQAKFEGTGGYRQDNLNWTIAGNSAGTSPNILSELEWEDLQILEVQGKAEIVLAEHFVLDGIGSYGQIMSGENQDSDFLGDNRTFEFSRSNNDAESGSVLDLSGGAGIRIHLDEYAEKLESEKLHLTLLGGYSYHEQNLEITNGFQTIPFTGSFAGLDSRYETQWEGPWAGFSLFGQKGQI